jgi:hypothetical protein
MNNENNQEINSGRENNENANNNTGNNQQGSFFSSFFFRMILMMVTMQVINRFFKGNTQNNSKKDLMFKNFLSENNLFDVEFYTAEAGNLNRDSFLKGNFQPILKYENLNYSNPDLNVTEFTKEIEVKWNVDKYRYLLLDFDVGVFDENSTKRNSTEFIERRKKIEKLYNEKVKNKLKLEELYLYAFIRFKNPKAYKNLEGFKNIELPVAKINLLKFSDSLKSDIKQQNMMNDFDNAVDQQESQVSISNSNENNKINKENFEEKKFLQNLYYKSELIFYLTQFNEREDYETFEEYRVMKIAPSLDLKKFKFFPNNFLTDFWNMNTDLKFITVDKNQNENSDATIKVKISFNFLSSFYIKYMKAIEMNSEMMENTFHIPSSKDMLVELLKNNSMSYLILLFTVNILHTVFSYMGFASDVSYYKNLKELDGVYTKYIFFSIFRLLVTFIYVYLEDAHFLVKIELGVALAVEIWKLRKIFSIEISTKFPFVSINYKIKFAQDNSQNHETEAISLMTKYLFLPISVLYLSYRIYYYKQTIYLSYFKFAIQYLFFLFNLFGFVLMTPQIYINYKLKCVSHMPVKALTYKFLNTIIDDLYAFAVKTTTLYRISCFKDDVIFVIFIIQMVLYRKNIRKEENPEIKQTEMKEINNAEEETPEEEKLIKEEENKKKEN